MGKPVSSLCLILFVLFCGAGCGRNSVPLELIKKASSTTTPGYTGNILISNSSLNTVVMYGSTGRFVKVVRDLNVGTEVPYGLVGFGSNKILAAIDGTDRIEQFSLGDELNTTLVSNSNLTSSPIQGIAIDSSKNIYVVESSTNTIEKFTSSGTRVGSPFINGVSGCTLSTARHIAVASDGTIAVTSSGNNRLLIYNSAGTTCVASVTSSPFSGNAPYGITYHSSSNKFIVALNGSSAIVSISTTGTGATTIYSDTNVISAPTALTVDSSGNILVVNTGYDSVEKLSFDGTTATRVGSSAFIPADTYIRDPSGIGVVP